MLSVGMSRVLNCKTVTSLEEAQLYMRELKSFRRFLFNEQTTADEKEI